MSLICYFLLIISAAIFSFVPSLNAHGTKPSFVPSLNAHGTKLPLSSDVFHGSKTELFSIKKLQSNTYPDGLGDYIMEIEIGTPPIKTYGLIDTGSDLVWLQCTTCDTGKCYLQDAPMFDPYRSFTYAFITCYDPICQKLPAQTSTCDNQIFSCIYNYKHATRNSRFQGTLSAETITLSQGLSFNGQDIPASITDFVFGCGYYNEDGGSLSISTGGIIGLNRGPLSLISQLGIREFSYCLPDQSSDIPGKITFGDDVQSKANTNNVVKTPLIKRPDSNFYYLNLEGATVAGKRIQNTGNSTKNGNIIIDSGSKLNYLDQGFYNSLEAAVKNATSLTPIKKDVPYYKLCYKEIPKTEVVFHFTGADLTLKPINLFVKVNDFFCFAMTPARDSTGVLYGNVAQRNFQVTYDLSNEFVSFGTTTNCGQHKLF